MWSALRQRWQALAERRALQRRAIPEALWRRTLKRFPFLHLADPADAAELRRLTSLFLDRKEFTGAAGFRITDDVAVAIAAQACLPVLRLGLQAYDGFVGIVVHRGPVVARREVADDDGVIHAYDEVLAGEAMERGPIALSWRDVRAAGGSAVRGYNVVIHEFAHVLDLADGIGDGVPSLPDETARQRWRAVLDSDYRHFCERTDRGEATALDPYAASGPDEFFAVASEAFFVAPDTLALEHPAFYGLLAAFYRRDPLKDHAAGP